MTDTKLIRAIILLVVILFMIAGWHAYRRGLDSSSEVAAKKLSDTKMLSQIEKSDPEQDEVALAETREEREAISKLGELASKGDWNRLQLERQRLAEQLKEAKIQVHPDNQVYFFHETLNKEGLEKVFYESDLKPGLERLGNAFANGEEEEKQDAYDALKSRVQSYELGASGEDQDLSESAQRFLKIYSKFGENGH